MCVAIEVVVFHGCKNIHPIGLISAGVTYKDYRRQSDRLSSEPVLGEAKVVSEEATSS